MTEWNDGIPHDPNYLTPKILNGMRLDLKWQEIFSRTEDYNNKPPSSSSAFHVLGGKDDLAVPPSSLTGWSDLRADAAIAIHPGGHFFHNKESIASIAASIIGTLEELSEKAHKQVTEWNSKR
jgi:surfactin synthase thioesterase subunit